MYHPVKVNLSHNQAIKLSRGQPVQLKPEDVGEHGSATIFLTQSQMRKLMNRQNKSKGMRIQLSAEQLAQTIQDGSGFRELLDSAKDFARSKYREYKPKVVNKIREEATKLLDSGIDRLKTEGVPYAEKKARELFDQAMRKVGIVATEQQGRGLFQALGSIFGLGVPRDGRNMMMEQDPLLLAPRAPMYVRKRGKAVLQQDGQGLFGNLIKVVAKEVAKPLAEKAVGAIAGNKAGSIAGNIAGSLASGLGVPKKRGRKPKSCSCEGAGLMPSGSGLLPVGYRV